MTTRDETRDIGVFCEWLELLRQSSEVPTWAPMLALAPGAYDGGSAWERFCPHSHLVDLERQLAEAKTERDFWRKRHQEDNEGLMFQLGRNLEFAQAAAFRHGATEPHPTIKCIQIIDEHAESLRHQLAERDAKITLLEAQQVEQLAALDGFLDEAKESRETIAILKQQLTDACMEVEMLRVAMAIYKDQSRADLSVELADREDAIREAMALIESEYEDEAYNRLAKALEKP